MIYTITGYATMEILNSEFFGEPSQGGMQHCPPEQVNMSDVHKNGAISPVWVIHSLSPVKNLYVHTILFQLPLGSNTISLQLHNCYGRGWMSCRSGGNTCSSIGRLGSVV